MPIMQLSWILAYLALWYYLWDYADLPNAHYATMKLTHRSLNNKIVNTGYWHIWHCGITSGETHMEPMPIMQLSWILAYLALWYYQWGSADSTNANCATIIDTPVLK